MVENEQTPAEVAWGPQTQPGDHQLPDIGSAGRPSSAPGRSPASRRRRPSSTERSPKCHRVDAAMGRVIAEVAERDRRRRVSRSVPGRRLPDRFGHVDQHEHERGSRDAGESPTRSGGASQRSCERVAVVERCDSFGHPHRRRVGCRRRVASGARTVRRVCSAASRASSPDCRQGRTHSSHGRHADHARRGVRRVRDADRGQHRAAARVHSRVSACCRSAVRRSAPASTPRVRFAPRVVRRLANSTALPLRTARDRVARQAAQDELVELSSHLRTLAMSLVKVANDVRWMASGPHSGLDEIELPALQAGFVDHAGQGESRAVRSRDASRGAGVRQRCRGGIRRIAGKLRTQHVLCPSSPATCSSRSRC